ncbi:VOC family protein [Roseovarius salis]|uniref:VOC family protein n=1 Tax=Roseovarius salis TaxID=3376063 RepID=UPI0037C94AE2
MRLELDHLAVAAETLEAGRAAVEDTLGVGLQPGGRHTHFGTHNLLLGLEEGLYLEVIAIDPGAPAPGYPRWFDLDRFAGRPRPRAWICRTDDLDAFVGAQPEAGRPVALKRGDLRWRMAVPDTGILPRDNAYPAVIQWEAGGHPADRLSASGCRLERLVVAHPDARALAARLAPVLRDTRVAFETGKRALRAEIATPHGQRVLE